MKPSHRNATKRNRNIGTVKQGHGHDNKLTIPEPLDSAYYFYERLNDHQKTTISLKDKELIVLVETLQDGFFYSCTPSDVETVLHALPSEDLKSLAYLVFRQPKKKEITLSPVWGRTIFDFQNSGNAAIMIEAIPKMAEITMPRKLSIEEKEELRLLEEDGLKFVLGKRNYTASVTPEDLRAVQLFRTLLHEVGHLKHHDEVINCSTIKWSSIPTREKERYANRYALEWKRKLTAMCIIPVK